MRNMLNVLARVRDSKKEVKRNKLVNKIRKNSKEDSVKSLDLILEKELNDELICLINTTADVSNVKENKNL